MNFEVFLKLRGRDEWVSLGRVRADSERAAFDIGQGLVARFLLEHEDAVDERAELRGAESGNVVMSWTPYHGEDAADREE